MSWLIRRAIVPAVMLSAAALAALARGNDVTEPALVRQPPAVVTEPALAPQPPAAVTEPALVPQAPAAAAGQAYGTRAHVVDAIRPAYPSSALRQGQEGWVELSFTIQPDGTVANPIVEDSTGVAAFERAAIAAILKTRYEPATWQGQPIEQCASRFRYIFSIGNQPLGARREFNRWFKEVVQLADEQRYAEAAARVDEMDRDGAWNHYEATRLWLLRSTLQGATGDKAGQLRSLHRASRLGGDALEDKAYRTVLLQRFSLEVLLNQYAAALATHETMKALRPPLVDPRVEKVVAGIEQAISGPDALSFPGVVEFRSGCAEGRPNWQHQLLRQSFTFDGIEGEVDQFELRCDWKRVVDTVSSDKTWHVPASWGWCQIFVFGAQGARVKLIEMPLTASERGTRRPPRVELD